MASKTPDVTLYGCQLCPFWDQDMQNVRGHLYKEHGVKEGQEVIYDQGKVPLPNTFSNLSQEITVAQDTTVVGQDIVPISGTRPSAICMIGPSPPELIPILGADIPVGLDMTVLGEELIPRSEEIQSAGAGAAGQSLAPTFPHCQPTIISGRDIMPVAGRWMLSKLGYHLLTVLVYIENCSYVDCF